MIHIAVDSAADIPKDIAEKYGIEVFPVSISYEDKIIREFYDIDPKEYHELLLTCTEIPKTAQISLEDYMKSFKKASSIGVTEFLIITINAKASGTNAAALMARDLYYEDFGRDMRIEIIDSETYSYIYGSVAVECAKMVLDDKSFDEIIDFAKKEVKLKKAYLAVFELKFLKKSGRISGGSAFVGEALGIKPISYVANAQVNVCDKARGDLNAVKKMLELVGLDVKNPSEQTAYIVKGICPESYIETMKDELINAIKFKNVEIYDLGASIVTNAGPKSVAIFYNK